MAKFYFKEIDYKHLLLITLKEKIFSFFIGLIFICSFFLYFLVFLNNNKYFFIYKKDKNIEEVIIKKSKNNYYIVQPGDDLWHISEKFYGTGDFVYQIIKENNLNESQPIEPGKKLIIPEIKTLKEQDKGDISAISTNKNLKKESYYIVMPGDSLSLISLKVYGNLFDWPKILKANNLINPDQIEVGEKLIIPN